jgi:CspA family cold shock protein
MKKGKVTRFLNEKSYGFIVPEAGGKELFVHLSEVEGGQLEEGNTVEYEETQGRRGKLASSVKVVN